MKKGLGRTVRRAARLLFASARRAARPYRTRPANRPHKPTVAIAGASAEIPTRSCTPRDAQQIWRRSGSLWHTPTLARAGDICPRALLLALASLVAPVNIAIAEPAAAQQAAPPKPDHEGPPAARFERGGFTKKPLFEGTGETKRELKGLSLNLKAATLAAEEQNPLACTAKATITYLQYGPEVRVETTISHPDCTEAMGRFELRIRTRDAAAGLASSKHVVEWSAADPAPFQTTAFYGVGSDVEVRWVTIRMLDAEQGCTCLDPAPQDTAEIPD